MTLSPRLARTSHLILANAALAALYFVAGKLGLRLAFVNESATAVWAPTGIAIASLVVLGYRVWPGILLGAFFVNITSAGSLATTLGITVGNTLEGVTAAHLVNRFANGRRCFERAPDTFKFALLAGLVATMVSATLGTTSLAFGGYAAWHDYSSIWLTWWLGDAGGALVVAPLLIVWSAKPGLRPRRLLEASALLFAIVLIGWVVFGDALARFGIERLPLTVLCLPPLIWAAFRFDARIAATVIILMSALALLGTLDGFGAFAASTPNQSLLLLQTFMGTISITTLAVAALVGERTQAQEQQQFLRDQAENERARLETVVQHMPVGVIIADAPSGQLLLANAQGQRILGRSLDGRGSRAAAGSYHDVSTNELPYKPSEWPLARALETGDTVSNDEIHFVRGDGTPGTLSVSAAPVRDAKGSISAGVVVFHDVTDQKAADAARAALTAMVEQREAEERLARTRAEEAVSRREAILGAVASAATLLLRDASWQLRVPEVLAALGRAAAVSRVYVIENHAHPEGGPAASQRHEWSAPGVESRSANPRYKNFSWRAVGLGRWAATLQGGQALHGNVRKFRASEQAMLRRDGVRSVAAVPIFAGKEWWGVMGLDDCVGDRDWSSSEMDALRTAADTLGAAIQRSRVEERIERQVERLSGLHAINVAIGASLDLGVTLNVLLDQVTTQLRVDAAAVLLFQPRTQTLEHAASRGFRTLALQHTLLRLGEGHAGHAALERKVVGVSDLRQTQGALARAPYLEDEDFIAYYAAPLTAKGQLKGVLELFHRAPMNPTPDWLDLLQTLSGQTAVAIENATLFADLQRSNLELTSAYDTTLDGWSRALDLRDKETEGHSRRVTELTLRLAREMGIAEDDLVNVRRGALLHDIGKMGIPDGILHKPGPLTAEEWMIMRRHPIYAYDLLSPIEFLRPALDIPYCHHEKWDGTGYPRGLKGESIPLAARIFACVDVWDAMRSDRPYRAGQPADLTRDHIRSLSGSHFDPQVIEVFLRHELSPDLPRPRVKESPRLRGAHVH